MKTSEFVRHAVQECLDADSRLCVALGAYWMMSNEVSHDQLSDVRDYIASLLYPFASLEGWLTEGGYDVSNAYAVRLQWAEWIAQQYEAIGD